MLVERPCRGRQSQDRASGAQTIDTDVGHASHGPTRKLALSEPPSNASGAIISPWRRWIASPHFQAIHHPSVDVARRLALLFGLGTKALPSWGFEDEVEQSFGRPRRQYDGGSKRTNGLTSSIVPRGTSFHRGGALFPPIAFDPAQLSSHCDFPRPPELGPV